MEQGFKGCRESEGTVKTEAALVGAGINPQRLADGRYLIDRVVRESTPYILFPYPAIRRASGAFIKNLHYLREKFGAKIVVDSGGFELAEGTATGIDPEDVIRIQNSVADFGFILDFPPDHEPFVKCLEMTKAHVKAASSIEKKFGYYLVVHGRGMEQMLQWYGELKDLDKFDGVSVSGIEESELLRGFIFFEAHREWKKWHFLGTSSFVQISLIHYLVRVSRDHNHEVERVSFDSTTPTQFGKACRVFHPMIPLEIIEPRKYSTEFLRAMDIDFDGTPSSAILTNVKALHKFNQTLSKIDSAECINEFVDVLLSSKQLEKWRRGKQVIDTAFSKGTVEALKLIPPELDRVAGLSKKGTIMNL